MKKTVAILYSSALTVLTLSALPLHAQVLLFDDFNSDTSGNYRVLKFTPPRDGVEFAFNYGALGIPEAPGSTTGGTTGVRMFANNPAPGTTSRTSAVQIIPTGLGRLLTDTDYRVTFDIWMNVNGPLPGGGTGSTEAFMAGVGWNGMIPIEAGVGNGTYFTLTGEGGATADVRSFTNDGFNAPGINVASTSLEDAYYAKILPGGVDVAALAVQGGQDNQTGVTRQGQMAFTWHQGRMDVIGDSVSFYLDDLLIAGDADAERFGNIMLGYADYFASESDAPQWSFGLFDNLRVVVIPEPAAGTLAAWAALSLLFVLRVAIP